MGKVMAEACRSILELDIPKVEQVDVWVQKLTIGVCDACTKLAKIELKLNLKIREFQLKAQPSTLTEIKEQCESTMKDIVAAVNNAVKDYTTLLVVARGGH